MILIAGLGVPLALFGTCLIANDTPNGYGSPGNATTILGLALIVPLIIGVGGAIKW